MHKLVIPDGVPFPTVKEAENELTTEAMRRGQGNQGVAATLLGISRPALDRKIAKYGLHVPR